MAVAIVMPGRRPVLGDAAGRHVDVERVLLEDLAVDAELARRGRGSTTGRLERDSRMTSPSWPVEDEVLLALHAGDLDGDDVAADLGDHEPGRGAGLVLGLQLAVLEARAGRAGRQLLDVDDGLALAALGDLPGDLAHDVGELALEVADAGLVGVRADELRHRLVGDLDVLVLEPVVLHLLGDQEALADLDLLLLGVAGQLDDLHPVAQGGRDRVEQVGRRDEEDLAQVEGHLEVVVLEGVVLLRVEDLEQGGARVAPEVHADLVDLVEHEHRVVRAGRLDALDDAAGQRADVRAPVAADLGLVVDAAEAHPHELAAHGPGDALAERRLADAGGADEGEDRAADLVREGAHREVLEDALLDLLEAVVVLVEDPGGFLDVELVVRRDVPGQADEPVHVGPDDARPRATRTGSGSSGRSP